jgi:hypothetical protein
MMSRWRANGAAAGVREAQPEPSVPLDKHIHVGLGELAPVDSSAAASSGQNARSPDRSSSRRPSSRSGCSGHEGSCLVLTPTRNLMPRPDQP